MRHQKVLNGIDELEIWLKDLLRNGLINIPERAYTLFDGIARRMVDAQAPGLANRLKSHSGNKLLRGKLEIQVNRPTRKTLPPDEELPELDLQPEEWQQEIRTQIGYPQAKRRCAGG